MPVICTEASLDYGLIAEIKRVGHVMGRDDLLSGFVDNLEASIAGFEGVFDECLRRGDTGGAVRAAHTLKGSCLQLGAQALGDLFADVEGKAKAGDHAAARRAFHHGAALIAQSLDALKRA
jgi:HPt (histidine-containing phosphotransfer) domain-containing protein